MTVLYYGDIRLLISLPIWIQYTNSSHYNDLTSLDYVRLRNLQPCNGGFSMLRNFYVRKRANFKSVNKIVHVLT